MAGQIVRQVDDSIVKVCVASAQTSHHNDDSASTELDGALCHRNEQSDCASHLAARQERIPALLLRLHDDMAADNQIREVCDSFSQVCGGRLLLDADQHSRSVSLGLPDVQDGCEGISAAHSLQHLVHLVLSVAPAHVSRSLVKKHKRCSQPRRRARAGRPTGCPWSLHHRPPEAAAGSWQSTCHRQQWLAPPFRLLSEPLPPGGERRDFNVVLQGSRIAPPMGRPRRGSCAARPRGDKAV
mmetsp:Transcript_25065/g.56575  ORF Transcript_25065/g.56575 Transcript_25065/m.56575 type:complete len:241 (+) Transcript_25065:454-1176(+)